MKILALSGSTREESFNSRLLDIAVAGARSAGAEVTVVDLKNYDLPLFNQDFEYHEGAPEAVIQLKDLMIEHQGLLIASPEYNGFPSPLLKNALDWVSRQQNDHEPPMFAYKGKIAAVMAASPGAGGGSRGLTVLRILLQNLGVMALPGQITLGRASQAFREDGRLHDDQLQRAAESLGADLYDVLLQQSTKLD
ncbi:NADPH-dependent FMN reductase [Amphritea japonica]|uniref:NADPH-dependent FMN reductase n=1 Tax=Amphritea japonica ATCC BAA-1530 TaxID=1278309 RepID=A0A7R6ST28_9GAMM|nr:NAD(P)H-dependent oxidoreductase [Amphritea japonica]BBB26875.1 NADPH-dependent FMN reductase [Amphritea japonica ATCC BAA-1530]